MLAEGPQPEELPVLTRAELALPDRQASTGVRSTLGHLNKPFLCVFHMESAGFGCPTTPALLRRRTSWSWRDALAHLEIVGLFHEGLFTDTGPLDRGLLGGCPRRAPAPAPSKH